MFYDIINKTLTLTKQRKSKNMTALREFNENFALKKLHLPVGRLRLQFLAKFEWCEAK